MLATVGGPGGVFPAGTEREVSDREAALLISLGYAEAILPAVANAERTTQARPRAEHAVIRKIQES